MTRRSIVPIAPVIGPVIRDRIRDLRERSGLDRDELATRAREYGLAEGFTANVVGFLERGRRGLTVEELLAIAQALEVSPLELLGDRAAVFVGEGGPAVEVECPTCSAAGGRMQTTVRADIKQLGDLAPLEQTLADTALRLAAGIDSIGPESETAAADLPRLTRELRATVAQILDGRRRAGSDDDEDDLDDLDNPDD